MASTMSTQGSKLTCTTCARSFTKVHALTQHIRDSSVEHHYCFNCDCSFHSKSALDQHLNSQGHVVKKSLIDTISRDRDSTPSRLNQHSNSSIVDKINKVLDSASRDRNNKSIVGPSKVSSIEACRKATTPQQVLIPNPPNSKEANCFECGRWYIDKAALSTHRGGGGPDKKCPDPTRKAASQYEGLKALYCEFCKTQFFVERALLLQHLKTTHQVCCDCDRRFRDKVALENHRASKKCTGKKTSKSINGSNSSNHSVSTNCRFCATAFANEDLLTKHIKSTHDYCDACNRHFADKRGLRKHKDSGACRSTVPCSKAAIVHKAVDHVQYTRLPEKPKPVSAVSGIQCQFCATPLTSKNDLDTHIRFSHAFCFDCGLNLVDKRAFARHKSESSVCRPLRLAKNTGSTVISSGPQVETTMVVGIKPLHNSDIVSHESHNYPRNKTPIVAAGVKCTFCSISFSSNLHLDFHVSAIHVSCPDCSRHFASKVELGHHLLAGKCSTSNEATLFHCALCNSCFPSVNALGNHVKGAHSSCEDCDRDFVDRGTLGRHWAEGRCGSNGKEKNEVKERAGAGTLVEALKGLSL